METVGNRENLSFSTTLLDAIYRSIDDEELVVYRETTREKPRKFSVPGIFDDHHDTANFRRACLIEKWMEKESCEKVVDRRKFPQRSKLDSLYFNSSSSSYDSSSGGGFSSSEAESIYRVPSRPKPIRTSSNQLDEYSRSTYGRRCQLDDSQSDKFVKKKSRAMKICGDLKKVKEPISPGGRLATFLNSLFTTGDAKKAKLAGDRKSKSKSASTASTCSSASSLSRSCLSKTPSSRGESSNGTKRSVRFCPVSVIVDEDCRPCGHKSLYGEDTDSPPAAKFETNSISEELNAQVREKNRRIEEAARNLLRNYQKKVECESDLAMNNTTDEINMIEEEDDDGDISCASSDLFELDNLSAIGMERYREELPVYETTHFDTNRAIANGFLM